MEEFEGIEGVEDNNEGASENDAVKEEVSPPVFVNSSDKKETKQVSRSEYLKILYKSKKVLDIPFLKFYGGPVRLPFPDAGRAVMMTYNEVKDLRRSWGRGVFVEA